jgi:epoxyqueuosine reductase
MKAPTMLETITSLLGTPACAIPLSFCKPAKGYLLERAGIPPSGTAILFPIPYVLGADAGDPRRNLSLYAVPRDYHGYVQELSKSMLPALSASFPAHRFALFADHSPICEVDAAARAGLGVVGLNGLLITPAYGSFVFIGEVVTDAPYEVVVGAPCPDFSADPPLCEGCGACLRACPAGCAGTGDRYNSGDRCDRGICLSALTQKKGALTEEEAVTIRRGRLVWGCDACQLACPHNRSVLSGNADTPIPYFRQERLNRVDTALLDGMTDEAFASRAYAWRGRAVIRRNAALFEKEQEEHEDR